MASQKRKSEPKHSREEISKLLSKAVSLEEIIVDTVAEMQGIKVEKVEKAFKDSDCSKRLFDFHTGYYLNDINILVSDFLREGADKFGWKL